MSDVKRVSIGQILVWITAKTVLSDTGTTDDVVQVNITVKPHYNRHSKDPQIVVVTYGFKFYRK